MKRIALAALAWLALTGAAAACDITARTGAPTNTAVPGAISVCRVGYELLYAPANKTALWSAEHLVAQNVRGRLERSNDFQSDPLIADSLEAHLEDYRKSGYSRGHLAPAQDFATDAVRLSESFYLTNMVPQVQRCNNGGVWSSIEEITRDWTVAYGELYVVTGPIYLRNVAPRYIGRGVRVPDGLFKALWNPQLNQTLAFAVPNVPHCGVHMRNFVVPVAQVEALTGLHLFPLVQASNSLRLWP